MRLLPQYRRSRTSQAILFTRCSLLALLVIMLMGIPVLTACEIDNDDNAPYTDPHLNPATHLHPHFRLRISVHPIPKDRTV